jgi:hypothetical protein
MPRQRLADRRQTRTAALANVPREESHDRASLPRPLTSAPASGDILRKKGTDSIPIVAVFTSDPVARGFVARLNHPGKLR